MSVHSRYKHETGDLGTRERSLYMHFICPEASGYHLSNEPVNTSMWIAYGDIELFFKEISDLEARSRENDRAK